MFLMRFSPQLPSLIFSVSSRRLRPAIWSYFSYQRAGDLRKYQNTHFRLRHIRNVSPNSLQRTNLPATLPFSWLVHDESESTPPSFCHNFNVDWFSKFSLSQYPGQSDAALHYLVKYQYESNENVISRLLSTLCIIVLHRIVCRHFAGYYRQHVRDN